ncbi:hypothetical protein K0M31_012059, partial [Melipona bicolor]
KLAAPSSQASPTSIPYAARAEIKTESIQPETSKGKRRVHRSGVELALKAVVFKQCRFATPKGKPAKAPRIATRHPR